MRQVQLPLFNDGLMHPLALVSRSIAPIRYRSFTQKRFRFD
jgi:hypothetical protein